ncbi:MAG: repeat protein precursor, partial [Verrucomicrobiales bacterium]|nr:repeat protein precursor [Verrucomicrobiales bacterium]
HAAVLLSAGKAREAEAELPQLSRLADDRSRRLAGALRKIITLTKGESIAAAPAPVTATEWLVESYRLQALSHLPEALAAARSSVNLATNFAFGWERVAELEFSFGRIRAASEALERCQALAPRNAQALALEGFILSAQNKIMAAGQAFDQAIELDSALANGWLGRGLTLIRRGQVLEGRHDIETAALVEPQRSFLRSYLGKAFAVSKDGKRALHELELAKTLDPLDPTPWLYSALILREENRINEAVTSLEKSIDLNNNRHVYRSEFLLDQDRAVRSSSLANIYRSAEMREVSVREAARAVTYDYGNFSAHQFLSESYNELRDPTRFNLRYETPWFNELLLANLLSPVGGTPLSQNISQQEYARLFERNRIGLTTDTSYRSDGRWTELASQYGRIGDTSWALDLDYERQHGIRPNNDLDRKEWYTTIKQQLTPQDSILLLSKYQAYHSGDNFQYYDPAQARPKFTYDETQTPIILGGYHREWSPGSHTLLLVGHLENEQKFGDQAVPLPILFRNAGGPVVSKGSINFDVGLHSEFDAYTAELQQIQQWTRQTLVVGARYQNGDFTTRSLITNPSVSIPGLFNNPPADITSKNDFERASGYGYYTVEPLDRLFLTAGVAYDYLRFPQNFRAPPITSGEDSRQRWSPKASIVWNPIPELALRGTYTRSLGGVTLDESYRLEPSQLAGFPQSFRSIMPESLVGSVAAPEFDTWSAALDVKLKTRTYLGVDANILESSVRQTIGVFDYNFTNILPSSTSQRL